MLSQEYSDILNRIYPADIAQQTALRVSELVSSIQSRVQADQHRLSAEDIVLITYGDTIREQGTKPLRVLHKFYKEYLKGLINSIHILPFHPYTSDDGFSVVDYYKIDSTLGDWSDIEKLGVDARLMFDAVVNHVSKSSPWFQGYLAGDGEYADWFIDVDPDEDLSMVTRPRSSPILSEFVGADGTARHMWTTFGDDQVDLNVKNPEVLLALLRVLLLYVEEGAKYIRLDAISFLWKEIGTSCIHLPQTHEIVRLIRRVVEDVNPATLIITETNVPHIENIAYLGDGHDQAHMVYNFALPPLVAHSLLTGSAEKLLHWAQGLELPSESTCFFNFTASHDGVGVRAVEHILSQSERDLLLNAALEHGGPISYRRNTDGAETPYELNISFVDLLSSLADSDELRASRLLASQAIALAMPGVPAIYVHSLFGSRNDLAEVKRTGQKRSINRSKLDLVELSQQLADKASLRSMVFAQMSKFLKARKNEPAFDPYGTFSFPVFDDRLFSVLRAGNDHRTLCLTNVSADTVLIRPGFSAASARDLITGADVHLNEISIPAYATLWLNLHGST